jgi:hypothetical protein
MLLCSAFGQWDATAHHPFSLFNMENWMRAQGASSVSGELDIHQYHTIFSAKIAQVLFNFGMNTMDHKQGAQYVYWSRTCCASFASLLAAIFEDGHCPVFTLLANSHRIHSYYTCYTNVFYNKTIIYIFTAFTHLNHSFLLTSKRVRRPEGKHCLEITIETLQQPTTR